MVGLAVALTLSVGGCGGEDEPEAPPGGGIAVSLGEWFVKPAQDAASAGEITFSAKNDGKVEHELEVVRTDTPAGDFPLEGDRANVDEVGEEIAEVHGVAPGQSKPLRVSLEPGKYVLICNFPRHYESGMHSPFTVR